MQGHLTQDCRAKVIRTPRIDGHCYNFKKYGHLEPLNVDQSLCGHLTNIQGETTMHTITIGTTIQGKVVTTVKNMVIYLRTT